MGNRDIQVDKLKNVVLLGHGSSGKTSLSEAMLYNAGVTNRLGKVDEGNTVSDYDAEEISRKISVNTSILPYFWKDYKINILDTPGYADFIGEVKGAVRVADGAIIVLDAVSGVEVGAELVWGYADDCSLPRLVFVNKMDRENASFQRTLDQLQEKFEVRFVPLQVPIGSEADFKGAVDVIRMKVVVTGEGETDEIPAELEEVAEAYRQDLMETAAEADDDLIMKYLEGEELTEDELWGGLKLGVQAQKVVPVLCGAATANLGVKSLMNAVVELIPSLAVSDGVKAKNPVTDEEEILEASAASPLATLVFKTMADPYVGKLTYFRVYAGSMESDSRVFNPRSGEEERIGQLYLLRGKEQEPVKVIHAGDIGGVAKLQETVTGDTLCDKDHPVVLPGIEFPKPIFSAAISPKTQADLDKMSSALTRLVEEDPTLVWGRDSDTAQTILSGMGESHIDIAVRRLQRKFGVNILTDIPKVPYRETITRTATAQGRHKKQTGGRGQFGDVFIRFEPLPRGSGFEFASEIRGGVVPSQYVPAVEKGMKEIIQKGVLAGYPTTDFQAVLYDGSYHSVDSSEIAFKLAAHLAFKKGIPEAGPVLLEPIYEVKVTVPEEFMGDILGDLNSRRAKVMGMDQVRGNSVVTAQIPLAEIQRYATDLRSMTQGRGLYSMEFSHYEQVPDHIAQQIIARAKEEVEKQ
ncbi:MAG: elongation factor G [Anaerolineae bacterium]